MQKARGGEQRLRDGLKGTKVSFRGCFMSEPEERTELILPVEQSVSPIEVKAFSSVDDILNWLALEWTLVRKSFARQYRKAIRFDHGFCELKSLLVNNSESLRNLFRWCPQTNESRRMKYE